MAKCSAKCIFHEKLWNSLNHQSSGSKKNYWHILKQLLGKIFNSGIPALQTDEEIIIEDCDKSCHFMSIFWAVRVAQW
jgi:hypothetical protein